MARAARINSVRAETNRRGLRRLVRDGSLSLLEDLDLVSQFGRFLELHLGGAALHLLLQIPDLKAQIGFRSCRHDMHSETNRKGQGRVNPQGHEGPVHTPRCDYEHIRCVQVPGCIYGAVPYCMMARTVVGVGQCHCIKSQRTTQLLCVHGVPPL